MGDCKSRPGKHLGKTITIPGGSIDLMVDTDGFLLRCSASVLATNGSCSEGFEPLYDSSPCDVSEMPSYSGVLLVLKRDDKGEDTGPVERGVTGVVLATTGILCIETRRAVSTFCIANP